MTNDNSFDKSSNKFQKYFSDNVIGSIHMSQYKDPNDDNLSYSSKQTQDLPNEQTLLDILDPNKYNLTQIHDGNSKKTTVNEETFNSTVNHIKILLDHTKRTKSQLNNNESYAADDPFQTFLIANDKTLNIDKRILLSQKRHPSVISRKIPTSLLRTTFHIRHSQY